MQSVNFVSLVFLTLMLASIFDDDNKRTLMTHIQNRQKKAIIFVVSFILIHAKCSYYGTRNTLLANVTTDIVIITHRTDDWLGLASVSVCICVHSRQSHHVANHSNYYVQCQFLRNGRMETTFWQRCSLATTLTNKQTKTNTK